jgi:hypothetical protein
MTVAMRGLSQRGYARHRGVTHRAVQKAIKAGRITPNPDGTIDPHGADAQWRANTDPASPAANRIDAEGTRGLSDPAPSPRARKADGAFEGGHLAPSGGYLASRAVREAYRARREKLTFERESAAVVSVEDVRAGAIATGRRIREHLLTLPDRLAPLMAGLNDPTECHRVITEEVARALDELNEGRWRSRT